MVDNNLGMEFRGMLVEIGVNHVIAPVQLRRMGQITSNLSTHMMIYFGH